MEYDDTIEPPPRLEILHASGSLNRDHCEPSKDQLWAHKDGGLYTISTLATYTPDGSKVVVYAHVWPFDGDHTYVRPLSEWTADRFTQMRQDHWLDCHGMRANEHYQVEITRRRQERKRKEIEEQEASSDATSSYVNQDR